MSDMRWNLKQIQRYADSALAELDRTPQQEAIMELMETCQKIDDYYRDYFCEEFKEMDGDDIYNSEGGVNVEFYIEADDWHDISKALRKIKQLQS